MKKSKHPLKKSKLKRDVRNEDVLKSNPAHLSNGSIAIITISVMLLLAGIIVLILYFTNVFGSTSNVVTITPTPIKTLSVPPHHPTTTIPGHPITNPLTNPVTHPITNPITNPLTNPITNPSTTITMPNTNTIAPSCPLPLSVTTWFSTPQNFVNLINVGFFVVPVISNGSNQYLFGGVLGATTQPLILPINYNSLTRVFSIDTLSSFNWTPVVPESVILSMFNYGSNGLGLVLLEAIVGGAVLSVRGYNKTTGASDNSFGTSGLLQLDTGNTTGGYINQGLSTEYLDTSLQHVISGNFVDLTSSTPCVWRINDSGTMDLTFGVNGIFKMPSVPVGDYSFTYTSCGKVAINTVAGPLLGSIYLPFVLANGSAGPFRFGFVACVTPSGTLDTNFNTPLGYIELGGLPVEIGSAMPPSIVLTNDSLYVCYADCPTGNLITSSITVAKYTFNGQLVTSFGTNGKVHIPQTGNVSFVAPTMILYNSNVPNGPLVIICTNYNFGNGTEAIFTNIYKLLPDTATISFVADIKINPSQESAPPGQTMDPELRIETWVNTILPTTELSNFSVFGVSQGDIYNQRPVLGTVCIG